MILIISTRVEQATIQVLKWLNDLDEKWFRINKLLEESIDYSIEIGKEGSNRMKLVNKLGSVELSEINSVWYRRREKPKMLPLSDGLSWDAKTKINANVFSEEQALFKGIVKLLDGKKWLSHPNNSSLNKLYQLDIATKIGLKIPETIVTTNKEILLEFRDKWENIIIKNIRDLRPILDGDMYYIPYIKKIEKKFLKDLPMQFFPTLAQECVEKKFEIRVFYLGGKIFSMAMFTQEDEQTSEDFRRYNQKRPTRRVRYKLPLAIEKKVRVFMEKVGLNTGSLDFIYSTTNEYIFLEVNPVGQYGMVSHPCNYNLSKEIALYLSN
jgi:ATP-GRASP peptide maturase of grasp-with-spasm system